LKEKWKLKVEVKLNGRVSGDALLHGSDCDISMAPRQNVDFFLIWNFSRSFSFLFMFVHVQKQKKKVLKPNQLAFGIEISSKNDSFKNEFWTAIRPFSDRRDRGISWSIHNKKQNYLDFKSSVD